MPEPRQEGCPVKGCPWVGPPDECPFPHYDHQDGNTFIDRIMQERPGR